MDVQAEYCSNTEKPVKQTLILSSAAFCVFASYQALMNLQTSLNQEQGLGVASLACIYGMFFLVSFFTPAIVYNVGVRGTILLSWVGHFIYMACNFYPHWGVLIPGSLLLGAVSCPLWTSLKTYLFSLSRVCVEQDLQKVPRKRTSAHAAFSHLNGIFFGVFSACEVTGSLLSSTILFQSSYDREDRGASSSVSSSSVTSTCGAEYCPSSGEGKHLVPPDPYIIYIMIGVFLTMEATGLLITWCFVPNLVQPRYTGPEVYRKLHSYWLAYNQPKLWLLVPLCAATGMNFSLHIGLFTEAFVSCALGIHMVGYVMSVRGLSTLLSAALLGYAARYTGRRFLFGLAFMAEAAIFVVFLLWRPHADNLPVFFGLSALTGLADGIWDVQNNVLIAVLFPDIVDSAFSIYSTWKGLTMSTSFLMAKFLCPLERIHVALGLLGAALLSYLSVEIASWRSLQTLDKRDQQYTLVDSEENNGEGKEEWVSLQENNSHDDKGQRVGFQESDDEEE